MKHASYFNIVLVFVCVLVSVLVACQPDESCRESMRTGMVCEFAEAYLDETSQIRYRSTWDSITAVGVGLSEILYNNSKNIQKLTLPLKKEHDQDSTIYWITYHDMIDTVTVYHTNQLEFVSVECGCTFDHDILHIHYTQHWIDTITIQQTTINRSAETNIRFERSTL